MPQRAFACTAKRQTAGATSRCKQKPFAAPGNTPTFLKDLGGTPKQIFQIIGCTPKPKVIKMRIYSAEQLARYKLVAEQDNWNGGLVVSTPELVPFSLGFESHRQHFFLGDSDASS